MLNRNFWKGRRVFVTGHTGFKGSWLSSWLLEMKSSVKGYALAPEDPEGFFSTCDLGRRVESEIADVLDPARLCASIAGHKPEVVFHLAAQSLVRKSYASPGETFATNVMGTVNLLEAVRSVPEVRAVVVVTSDKCYVSRDGGRGFIESDPLGGHDPYSASKACTELVAHAYYRSFFESAGRPVGLATVRAGNVVGGGDWGADRLVPDAMRALRAGRPLKVRFPDATRPWQHALEPLHGYLMLAERLHQSPGDWAAGWNFGPLAESGLPVSKVADLIVGAWGTGSWEAAPDPHAPREAQFLGLDSSKAREKLGWLPRLSLEEALALTVQWYRQAFRGPGADAMFELSRQQIGRFESL